MIIEHLRTRIISAREHLLRGPSDSRRSQDLDLATSDSNEDVNDTIDACKKDGIEITLIIEQFCGRWVEVKLPDDTH